MESNFLYQMLLGYVIYYRPTEIIILSVCIKSNGSKLGSTEVTFCMDAEYDRYVINLPVFMTTESINRALEDINKQGVKTQWRSN